MKRIKVMVVDDNPQFASAAAQFLARIGGFEVLANAHSGQEALSRARSEQPDLMLIDMRMPGLSGMAVASLIKAEKDAPKIVLMTLGDGEGYRGRAASAGADAFLTKDDFASALCGVVDTLFGGSATQRT